MDNFFNFYRSCPYVLKLTVVKKSSINTYSNCRVLNVNMIDSTGVVRVSAFNSLSDNINEIFEVPILVLSG